ncbi:MAG: methylamine utilization protein [Gammaproteobacteria bacterium]
MLRRLKEQGESGMGAGRWFVVRWLLLALPGLGSPAAALGGQPVSLLATGSDGRPAAGVVVFLPDVQEPADTPVVVVDQRGEAFVPAISVVRAGSEVQFTNSDATSHHVYSFSKPNAFALPLYKGSARLAQRFDRPGVVVLGCNIHDSMLGYIIVVESARSGVTGPDGRVTLYDVPAGRHVIKAWAPGLDRTSPPDVGVVDVTATAPAALSFRVGVAGGTPAPKKRGALAGGNY